MVDTFNQFAPDTLDYGFGASENRNATLDSVASENNDTKVMEQLDKDVCTLTGITRGLGDAMTNPDGSFIDIADKEGRAADRKLMEKAKNEMTDFMDGLPTKVDATLNKDDRARIDLSNKNFRMYRWIDRIFLVVAGAAIALCLNRSISYDDRSKELEIWYKDKGASVAFAEYIKEHDPDRYTYYQSGQWQRSVAYRDSIRRAHAWKEWDKEVKKGK